MVPPPSAPSPAAPALLHGMATPPLTNTLTTATTSQRDVTPGCEDPLRM
jgi:hypothetical protein